MTFYIDTLFAPAWQQGIRRGIGCGTKPSAGSAWGDVLKAEAYPADGFDSNNPGGFYVKYVASTIRR